MANVRLAVAPNQAAMVAVTDKLDVATPVPGYIEILDGSQPASATIAKSGQVTLAVLDLSLPAVGAPDVNGRVDFASIVDDTLADATGTATWARWYDGAGLTVFDCDVGVAGATLNLNTTSITAGGVVSIVSFYLQHPDGS